MSQFILNRIRRALATVATIRIRTLEEYKGKKTLCIYAWALIIKESIPIILITHVRDEFNSVSYLQV